MSNNKQSSVEWLVKELNQKIDFIPMSKWDEIKEVIEQAKGMHKEEIIEAYTSGVISEMINPLDAMHYKIDSQEFYEKKYGQTMDTTRNGSTP